jgi:hypothetical protein
VIIIGTSDAQPDSPPRRYDVVTGLEVFEALRRRRPTAFMSAAEGRCVIAILSGHSTTVRGHRLIDAPVTGGMEARP